MIDIPTWKALDVLVDDLEQLADHHQQLGIRRRDARTLQRVARQLRDIDTLEQRKTA